MKKLLTCLSLVLTLTVLMCCFSSSVLARPVSTERVLLINMENPWGYATNQDQLDAMVTSGRIASYDVRTFADVNAADFDLSVYTMVLVANQVNDYNYNDYTAVTKAKLEAYASAGGTLFFGIASYTHVVISAGLPGDVVRQVDLSNTGTIANPTSPIVTREISGDATPLTDADLLGDYFCHFSLVESSLPVGSDIIMRSGSSGAPTLVEFSYGNGHIIYSGITWEYACYNWETGFPFGESAYDDLLLYGLSLADCVAPSVTGISPSAYLVTDGKITGTSTDMGYKLLGATDYIPVTGTEITGLSSGTYLVRNAASIGYLASPDASVVIPYGPLSDQTAPVVGGISSTGALVADGKISGTTTAMEYKLSTASAYTPVTGTEITSLVAGTYYVRYAAKVGYNASADAIVTISALAPTPTATPTAAPTATPAATATPKTDVLSAAITKTGEGDTDYTVAVLLAAAAVCTISFVAYRAKRKEEM